MFRTSGYPYNNQKLVFDGNNHSISGLYANGSGPQGFALYNYGMIKNLQIKNSVFISTDGNAGGIVAGFLLDRLTIRSVCWRFTVCFGILSTARVKKERCFCCAARCFLQTAFAISTPVSFLCIFPSFHLVVKERQGAVPMAERYFAFLRILFRKIHRGHLLYGFICSRETKNGRTMLCGIVRPLADADRKTVLL